MPTQTPTTTPPMRLTDAPPARLLLRDAKPGDSFDDVYLLTNKQLGKAKNGESYLKGFVGDRTAALVARWWRIPNDTFDRLPDNGFVRLLGRIEQYQDNLQVVLEKAWEPREGSFDPADLIPSTTRDVPQMFARLTGLLGTVANRHLKALLNAYLADEELMDDLRRAPAAQSMHHAFLGGLLEHTLNACEVADAVCPFYPGLNRDLVVAGIFLHDIAKTWELSFETAFAYTDGGQLVGHIVKAAMWVDVFRRRAEDELNEQIPQILIDVLQHIILSHHGHLEFGSPKLPMTPEALVVHRLEEMDAKLMPALAACRGPAVEGAGPWTDYSKAFNGRLFRPDVARAEDDRPDHAPAPRPAAKVAPPVPPVVDAPPVEPPPPAEKPKREDRPIMITNPLFESADTGKRR